MGVFCRISVIDVRIGDFNTVYSNEALIFYVTGYTGRIVISEPYMHACAFICMNVYVDAKINIPVSFGRNRR